MNLRHAVYMLRPVDSRDTSPIARHGPRSRSQRPHARGTRVAAGRTMRQTTWTRDLALALLLSGCGASMSPVSDGGDSGGSPPADTAVTARDAQTPADDAPSPAIDAASAGDASPGATYGQTYTGGQYHLGPVDYAETQWHNACAPATHYDSRVQAVEGTLLAGLWSGIPNTASYCDACIRVTTGAGRTAVLRVVTYGDTTPNSIDVSPDAYAMLNTGEYPRAMTWQFTECPASGPMLYEFQTGSNAWWTSLWVRNARVPVARVEVQSTNHASFVALERGTDGTLTDNSGFGEGAFTIRTTGVDGQVVTEHFAWPASGIAGAFLTGTQNFQ
jgi:expansin (peptidoglycan-binding protein)